VGKARLSFVRTLRGKENGPAVIAAGPFLLISKSVTDPGWLRYVEGMPITSKPGDLDLFELAERNSPTSKQHVLLPDDLASSLRLLTDGDLYRLRGAVANEVTRRVPPPDQPGASQAGAPPQPARADVKSRPASTSATQAAGAVTAARASAIRAAFRAGLKPAKIAREFGVPQSLVQQVLRGAER
jgi:hypothetical protein